MESTMHYWFVKGIVRWGGLILLVAVGWLPGLAQDSTSDSGSTGRNFSEAVMDNSFLIEEAYNQEAGVVQHIFGMLGYGKPLSSINFGFTQEWPVGSQKHQFSYSLAALFLDHASVEGLGDVMINYRYQLMFNENGTSISPRISLVIPTGDARRGLGYGNPGLLFNLPISRRISEKWAGHLNAGMTIVPKAEAFSADGTRFERNLDMYNLGGSLIWLTTKNTNLMLEGVVNFYAGINETGSVQRFNEYILSPGLRHAINVGSLQIVPGVAMPNSWLSGQYRAGVFVYLSFEHPFKKVK
jgi:hypothetical protein